MRCTTSVGVTRQTIIAIEQGKYSPSLEVAFQIARVFGVPLEDVFSYADDADREKAFALARSFSQRLPAALEELPRDCACLVVVITSYSIHYTKLYEPTRSGAAGASSSTPMSTCTGRRCWPACRSASLGSSVRRLCAAV